MKEAFAQVQRVYLDTETLGSWYIKGTGELMCKTMELPWKDNRKGISCFPEGIYFVTKEPPIPANDPKGRRERKYWHFRIHNVPGRSGILVHLVSKVKQLKGCIGVGEAFKDLDGDLVLDMVQSTNALNELIEKMPDEFWLEVIKKP